MPYGLDTLLPVSSLPQFAELTSLSFWNLHYEYDPMAAKLISSKLYTI